MKRSEIKRGTGLKQVGKRVSRERKAMVAAYRVVDERADDSCEASVEGECTGCGVDHHHVGPRSTHPHLRTDPTNILLVCRPCHAWIGDNPLAATELGLHKKAET